MREPIDNTIRINISKSICRFRDKSGMNQEHFANYLSMQGLEISKESIAKWESGENTPQIDKLVKLAEIFHCSVDDICGEKGHSDLYVESQKRLGLDEQSTSNLMLHFIHSDEKTAINALMHHSLDIVEYMEEIRRIKHGYDEIIAPMFKQNPDIRRAYKKALRQTMTDNTAGEELFYNLIKDRHIKFNGFSEKSTAEWIYKIAYMYEGLKYRQYEIIEIMDNVISDYTNEMKKQEDERITVTSIEDALSEDTERE